MDTPSEPAPIPVRRNLAAWASGFLGIILGIAVGWQGSHADSLSMRELSVALGIRHWRYTIPQNAESEVLTFEIRDGNRIKTSGGSTGWKPGETITITVRPLIESRMLECSMIGKDKHGRFLLDNPFASLTTVHYADDGTSVNGAPLMRGNHHGGVTVVPVDSTKPGDVSLSVVMEKSATAVAD